MHVMKNSIGRISLLCVQANNMLNLYEKNAIVGAGFIRDQKNTAHYGMFEKK